MSSFINTDLDNQLNVNLFFKHSLYSIIWIVGIAIFVFRADVVLLNKYNFSKDVFIISIPLLYTIIVTIICFFLKWYYIIALLFYPILIVFWFLPKTILSVGKVYLFSSYLNFIFLKFSKFPRFIVETITFIISFLLLITVNENWPKYLAIIVISYFYSTYLFNFLKSSFKQPSLFGSSVEEWLNKLFLNDSFDKSLVISTFIQRQGDSNMQEIEKRNTHIKRAILASYFIENVTHKLNNYRGRQAYIIAWLFSAINFLIFSIMFFWFLNLQLYNVNKLNFTYTGYHPEFDYLYYTLKTITFGDIDIVKPISIVARISEMLSFAVIGIFLLVIFASIFFSMQQEKIADNIKLTTDVFHKEHSNIIKYIEVELGLELKAAFNEIKNIDESIRELRSFLDKIF